MKGKVTERNKRRYSLHSTIRKQGYVLITKQKTVYVHHSFEESEASDALKELRDVFKYNIQFEIR